MRWPRAWIGPPAVVRRRRTTHIRLYIITIMRSRNANCVRYQRLACIPFQNCARQRPPEARFNAVRTARHARRCPQEVETAARIVAVNLDDQIRFTAHENCRVCCKPWFAREVYSRPVGAVIPSLRSVSTPERGPRHNILCLCGAADTSGSVWRCLWLAGC